jgi:glycosyltransferase involved in cell wall biosynthesis
MSSLRQFVTEHRLGKRVHFVPFQSNVAAALSDLEVLIHASLRPEPFGRVIIEAMAMRKPVIASKAGGPLEIVDDGINGFLVPPGDDAELAEKIVLLLTNPELASQLGHEAYLKTRRCHTIEQHVEAVSRVYRSMLRDTGRSQQESFVESGSNTPQDRRAARQDPGVGG